MMKRIQWHSLLLGAATFFATHLVVVRLWAAWFDGRREPWFLDSGRAVGFTAFCVAAAAAVASASWGRNRSEAMVHGANVAAGALLAMIAVLVSVGPGTIFPIVILFGGAILLVSSAVGSLIVLLFKSN
jgi:hypothetical protein